MSDSNEAGPSTQPQSQKPPATPDLNASTTSPSSPEDPDVNAESSLIQPGDRLELINRARSFLTSPHIQQQDIYDKRRFLTDKGLTESEVDGLLRELPPQIPPRTYPQPPPSNLPALLLGLARLISWITGASAVILLIYHRFLLPRLVASSTARRSIKSHQISLLQKFTASLTAAKAARAETLSALPRTQPFEEPETFIRCSSVQDVLRVVDETTATNDSWSLSDIPPVTLLRCAIADYVKVKPESSPTTEDLFMILQGKVPQLIESEDGPAYQRKLWETLSTGEIFTSTPPEVSTTSTWSYTPLPAPAPSAPSLINTLTSLRESLPKEKSQMLSTPRQNTVQALSEFTGYISSQLYRMPQRIVSAAGGPPTAVAIEEELKREIRALKGLVLNRRSFLPPKVPSATSLSANSNGR